MIGIYKIENLINNKIYIGQSTNCEDREHSHFVNLRLNSHHNKYLQRSYNKYGKENFIFEIIEVCEENKLNEREIYWIEFLDSISKGYNMCEGGNVPPNLKNSLNKDEICKKISKSLKGKSYVELYGEEKANELKKKRSELFKNIKRTDEWKNKISNKLKGVSKSEETKDKIRESRNKTELVKRELKAPYIYT